MAKNKKHVILKSKPKQAVKAAPAKPTSKKVVVKKAVKVEAKAPAKSVKSGGSKNDAHLKSAKSHAHPVHKGKAAPAPAKPLKKHTAPQHPKKHEVHVKKHEPVKKVEHVIKKHEPVKKVEVSKKAKEKEELKKILPKEDPKKAKPGVKAPVVEAKVEKNGKKDAKSKKGKKDDFRSAAGEEDLIGDADFDSSEIEEYAEELSEVEAIDEATEDEELMYESSLKESKDEEVVLTDAEGRRYCRVRECDQVAAVETYCRYHYLYHWKRIQIRKKILADGKLVRYVEELTVRYPDKFLEMIRRDLRTEKDFLVAIQELEIDDSGDENDFEEDTKTFIDEVRGATDGGPSVDEEEF
jgi:hypothetical protein